MQKNLSFSSRPYPPQECDAYHRLRATTNRLEYSYTEAPNSRWYVYFCFYGKPVLIKQQRHHVMRMEMIFLATLFPPYPKQNLRTIGRLLIHALNLSWLTYCSGGPRQQTLPLTTYLICGLQMYSAVEERHHFPITMIYTT